MEEVFNNEFEEQVEQAVADAQKIREEENSRLNLMTDKERIEYLISQGEELKQIVKNMKLEVYNGGDEDEN
ncbi:MAG: hypothetical protein J6A51_04055 [Clostridia bacterium]|nr:hypothetical protein [Clostridia bacterium]